MAVISFKCPNCDGELIFDPESGAYKCEYCDSRFTQEQLDAMKPASENEHAAGSMDGSGGMDPAAAVDNAAVYHCPSCGAEIVTDATTAATYCYYCQNPVVLSGRLTGKYLPDKVVPFSIDRKKAEEMFLGYVGGKKFVPKAFFHKKQMDKLSGVYFPFWMYEAEYTGRMKADATKVRVWTSGDERYTETKYYQVTRAGQIQLQNLELNALNKANKKLVEGVLPYQLQGAKDFSMGYLSGFQAEKRDIESAQLSAAVRQETEQYARNLIRESISGYDRVNVSDCAMKLKHESWSYVLLPIWTITYRGNDGKIYYYSLNGQTGKVCGELPIAYGKLAGVSGIIAAVVLALGLLGGLLIW